MKFTVLAVVATALALLAVSPCASAAQAASIQASVTVLEPSAQPSVRMEASEVEGGEAAVVVEGMENWAVSVQVGDQDVVFTSERSRAGHLEFSASDWAMLARESDSTGSTSVPVRVVLAAH